MVDISIVIPVHNQLQYTKMCLESIRQHTHNNYEVIIVNNGSRDDTCAYLDEIPHLITIHNQENLGFARAVNQGLRLAQGNYLIVLNNDCLVSEGWERRLLHVAHNQDVGIVGVMSNFVASPQLIQVNINNLEDIPRIARQLENEYNNSFLYTIRVVALCMLIKRDLMDKIGGFDPLFGLGYFEDDDYCLRSFLSGYKNVIAQDVFIYHFGSRTFRENKRLKNYFLRTNWQKFKEKWDLPLDLPLGSKDYWESLDVNRFKTQKDMLYIPLDKSFSNIIYK